MSAYDLLADARRQRIDPIAEPRRHLTPARPRREVIGPFKFYTDPIDSYEPGPVTLVGPNEARRRYADQQARKQAEELSTDGYVQARALDLAAEREAVATDLGDHGCDRSTALHFAAIVVAGLVARGKL